MFSEKYCEALGFSVLCYALHKFVLAGYYDQCGFLPILWTWKWYGLTVLVYLVVYQCAVFRVCERVMLIPFIALFFGTQLLLILQVVFMLLGLFKQDCMGPLVKLVDGVLLAFALYWLQRTLFICLKVFIWISLIIGRVEDIWSNFDCLFTCCLDRMVSEYIFNQTVNDIKLTDKELAVMKANHGGVFQLEQRDVPANSQVSCFLCRQAFRPNDPILRHPDCFDTFHEFCLERHYSVGRARCPQCQIGTRTALVRHIHRSTTRALQDNLIGHEIV